MTTDAVIETAIETPAETPAAVETPILTGHQQFLEMLPEDMRADPAFRNFDGETASEAVGKLGKSYVNAQKLVGADKNAILKLPSSEEDTEGWDAVYSKMGRPDDVAGYEVDKYKDIPGIEEESLNEIAAVAHKNGVSSKALNAILDTYKGQVEGMAGKSEQDMDAMHEKFDTELREEYGEAYDQRTAKVLNAVKQHASEGLLNMAKDMPWVFDSPDFIKFVDSMVKSSSEDGGPKQGSTGGNSSLSPNEAQAEINAMDGDTEITKILLNSGDPRRVDILAKRKRLFEQAYPAK